VYLSLSIYSLKKVRDLKIQAQEVQAKKRRRKRRKDKAKGIARKTTPTAATVNASAPPKSILDTRDADDPTIDLIDTMDLG